MNELELMVQDNASSSSPYKTTDLVWTRLASLFRQNIRAGHHRSVEGSPLNASFASYGRNDARYQRFVNHLGDKSFKGDYYAKACELYHAALVQRNSSVVERATLSAISKQSPMSVTVAGQAVTWDHLLSIDVAISMFELQPFLQIERANVVDLGAGWGRLGSVLVQLNPNLTYIVSDIPESLIVAQTYLPLVLPTTPSRIYSTTREIKSFGRETFSPGLWFCGTQDLERFEDATVDAFVNLFSFQEMTMQQVTEYFAVIDRVACGGAFYSQQRLAGDVMTRENHPYPSRWKNVFDKLTLFSPAYFETAFRITPR